MWDTYHTLAITFPRLTFAGKGFVFLVISGGNSLWGDDSWSHRSALGCSLNTTHKQYIIYLLKWQTIMSSS